MNYCRVDVPNVGGFTEAMKVAGWWPLPALAWNCAAAHPYATASQVGVKLTTSTSCPTTRLGRSPPPPASTSGLRWPILHTWRYCVRPGLSLDPATRGAGCGLMSFTSQDNFDPDNMHQQWNPEVFPKLLMRETTIERHASLGYPVPREPGLGIEINEHALITQPPFKFWNPPFLRCVWSALMASASVPCEGSYVHSGGCARKLAHRLRRAERAGAGMAH
jgi:hypothetical protein